MDDDDKSHENNDAKLFAELTALFGLKKASDIYFIFNIIRIALIAAWLFWCCSGD